MLEMCAKRFRPPPAPDELAHPLLVITYRQHLANLPKLVVSNTRHGVSGAELARGSRRSWRGSLQDGVTCFRHLEAPGVTRSIQCPFGHLFADSGEYCLPVSWITFPCLSRSTSGSAWSLFCQASCLSRCAPEQDLDRGRKAPNLPDVV